MNRKQFAILVVVLIVVGGFAWTLQRNRQQAASSGEQGTGQKLMGSDFPMNDVARISIKEGTNDLNLVKKDDLWRVKERYDYPANFSMISEFLIKARDLKVVQNEPVGASQLARLDLLPPGQGANTGTAVDFLGKDDKSIKSLTLGKKHLPAAPAKASQFQMGGEGMADGRYVMVGGNSQNALLIADALNNIEAKPEDWLDKDFIRVERPKAIEVTYPAATNSWRLEKDAESGDWKLAAAKVDEKLDAARVSGVSSPFSSASFNDVLSPDAKDAETGLAAATSLKVETFDGFTFTIKIGKKIDQNYPVTIAVMANFPKWEPDNKSGKTNEIAQMKQAWDARQKDLQTRFDGMKKYEHWIYLVPTWNIDPVLKDRKDLLVEKKDEAKPDAKTPEVTEPFAK